MGGFDEILKQSVDYVASHGFDDSPQLKLLMQLLRQSADRSFISADVLQNQMKAALETYYKRATSKAHMTKAFNGSVSRMTIDAVAPRLRAELDRRIMANADLIVLNRQQAIDKTLQRFSGWMTSVPAGGSRAIDKGEVIQDIKKTARQLKYEVRRRDIDQGHKLIASIDAVIAMQTNAIALIWQSKWRRPGYDYREDHKERDGKVYAIRGNWAIERGLMNKGIGYYDEITPVAMEPYCSCSAIYLSSLSELPESMLTEKGKQALKNL
ncbi:MAG: structural protein [Thiobacillus sp.]